MQGERMGGLKMSRERQAEGSLERVLDSVLQSQS